MNNEFHNFLEQYGKEYVENLKTKMPESCFDEINPLFRSLPNEEVKELFSVHIIIYFILKGFLSHSMSTSNPLNKIFNDFYNNEMERNRLRFEECLKLYSLRMFYPNKM
jgi:hypothetical protein